MKRMYVALFIIFSLLLGAGTLLGQNNSDLLERRMQMREEMHRRMMDKLLNGVGPDQDMFSDMEKMMDEIMTDSFNGLRSFGRTTSQEYKLEWKETSESRTLIITPKGPEQNLDISVSNGLIVIKGKSEEKTPHGSSYSNFTNSFNVPMDCDGTKVQMEQKDGKIVMKFPYRAGKVEERKPIPPSDSDIQI